MNMLRTRFTSSHYCIDEGQSSNSHEHVNESGAPFDTNNAQHSPVHSGGQRISFESGLGCTNEGVSERPNMLVLVQSCMDNNADVAPQASEEIIP